MKKNYLVLPLIVFLLLSIGLVSCDSNEEESVDEEVSDETLCESNYDAVDAAISQIETTVLAYVADPTTENCNIYKTSLIDYLDIAEELIDCLNLMVNKEEVQSEIDIQREILEQITCE